MKKTLNWFLDKWLAGFITASIFFFAKIYYDLPPDQKRNFFHFQWVSYLVNFRIELWKVFLIVLFLLFMFKVSRGRNRQIRRNNPTNRKLLSSPFISYKTDQFGIDNAKWTWNYDYNESSEQINIINLAPLCPICDTPMLVDDSYGPISSGSCSKCRLEGRNSNFAVRQNQYDVQQEIIRRITSEEYKTK